MDPLSGAWEAQAALERASTRRAVWVHLTAALGAPAWLLLAHPRLGSALTHRLAGAMWALSALQAAFACAHERRWRRARDRHLAQLPKSALPSGSHEPPL